jgi:hypothetical protein
VVRISSIIILLHCLISGIAYAQESKWAPSAEQQKEVERLTRSYFSFKDGENYRAAYALLATTQSFDEWQAMAKSFNRQAGTVRSRKIAKVTWYNNSPQGPAGIFAAVDFMSEFENLSLHCGYVVWRLAADGSFQQIREEQNSITHEMQKKLTPEMLKAARAQFRC